MFDHVQIKVNNFVDSRRFYETVLRELGYKVVLEFEDAVGIGSSTHDMFEIAQADENHPVSERVHLAFIAKSQDAVRHFHAVALECGAKDNGKPGFRGYEDGYFAAFVIDLNGHNLEAVFHTP